MSGRVVRLVERRTRECRLPRAEAEFLLTQARPAVDVQPGFARGSYRVTPRGFVGFLDGPTVRFEIRPKLPWPNLMTLLGLGDLPAPAGERVAIPSALLGVLAGEFAGCLRAVTRSGLVRGYGEQDAESGFLRGRLRTADQLRDAAARAFPDRFHVTETVFDLDTPWNRIPKAVASALLAHPDLSGPIRAELATAVEPLESVPVVPVTGADFEAAAGEPRAAGYQPLLALCRVIRDGLRAADPTAGGRGGFLVDLGRAFENYLAESVRAAFVDRAGWSVESQPRFPLGTIRGEPLVLQPDIVIRRGSTVRAVLDAKWKRPTPDPGDLHQILAYAAVTGADRVGLVYPGRAFAHRSLTVDARLRVGLFRVPVVGPAEGCAAGVERLARAVRRNRP